MESVPEDGQIVDGKLHIVSESLELSHNIDTFIKQVGLYNRNLDYDIVAVFGSQSTGKSTLLNMLFETGFDVMSTQRRQQTTKGLWMSRGKPENLLVIDVEGTDGRERGEQLDMERKSALFSLAVAEVLIVNMFEQDVGRYNGANYGLLKTVFEVNLQLFLSKGSPKTRILFVIRDHESTPLEAHEEVLRTDLNAMFADIKKPAGFEKKTLTDFFDLSFVGLPHKVFKPQPFEESVVKLRSWFRDRQDPNYLFRGEYSRRIPIDGFSHYATSIWQEIIENRDLDLPSQRQLLARFRCNAIMKEALSVFQPQYETKRTDSEAGKVIDNLGEWMQSSFDKTLQAYVDQASKYDTAVFEQVKSDLQSDLQKSLNVVFVSQLRNLQVDAEKTFVDQFESQIGSNFLDFSKVADSVTLAIMSNFEKKATEITLKDSGWSYAESFHLLQVSVEDTIARSRRNAIKMLADEAKEMASCSLTEIIDHRFHDASVNMWLEVQGDLEALFESTKTKYSVFLAALGVSQNEADAFDTQIAKDLQSLLVKRLRHEGTTDVMLPKLRRRFERCFKYDEHNRPRNFTPETKIVDLFDKSVTETEKLLERHTTLNLDLQFLGRTLTDEDRVLISFASKGRIWDTFLMDANSQFKDVQNLNTPTRVPLWGWVAMAMLAYNDLFNLVTAPVTTVITFVWIGVLFYAIYYFSETYGLQQPATALFTNLYNQGMARGQELFVQYMTGSGANAGATNAGAANASLTGRPSFQAQSSSSGFKLQPQGSSPSFKFPAPAGESATTARKTSSSSASSSGKKDD